MEFMIDRDMPIPLHAQLQGQIEYGIACGELVPGTMLPSVRDLADRLGIASVTVSQVYATLKKTGLIDARSGAGTFVADSARARFAGSEQTGNLLRHVDQVIDEARALGMSAAEFLSLVSSRFFSRDSGGSRFRIVIVGLFGDATAHYARFIADRLGPGVVVEPFTLDMIGKDETARGRAGSADLVVTFANRQREVADLLPTTRVVTLSFTPTEETRMALATLDSLARVVIVSRFPDFLPVMKSGVQRFAPHVSSVVATALDACDLDMHLAGAGVVVHATGAEAVVDRLHAGTTVVEYRHEPDKADIERVIVPIINLMGLQPVQSGS